MYAKLFSVAYHLSHSLPGNLAFILIGISAAGAFAWQRRTEPDRALWISAIILLFGAADLLMLAALPRLGLSFGPTRTSLIWISGLRMAVWIALGVLAALLHRSAIPLSGLAAANLLISALAIYGMYFEPFNLQVSRVSITSPKIHSERPIRIAHLSDIHVERITRRERAMIEKVKALEPDLIVLTGDYLNVDYTHDPQAQAAGRETLAQLSAPYGVFAVTGSRGVDQPTAVEAVLSGLPIRLLRDEIATVEIEGQRIDLAGIALAKRESDRQTLQKLMREVPEGRYSILLYHTPDLAEAAAANRVDLYLAGHTHGGQIRLPWWGALVTMSAYGKRFEMGAYTLGDMTLYVSRGIGMEGLRLPRARFLARPEIVLIELEAGTSQPKNERPTTP